MTAVRAAFGTGLVFQVLGCREVKHFIVNGKKVAVGFFE